MILQSSPAYPVKHTQSPSSVSHVPRFEHSLTYSYSTCFTSPSASTSSSLAAGVNLMGRTKP